MTRTSSFALLLLAAGCPAPEEKPPVGDPPADAPADRASFAGASEEEARAAFMLGSGMSLIYASLAQMSAEMDSTTAIDGAPSTCPGRGEIGRDPLVVRYEAGEGCTSPWGIDYAGTLEATNPGLFDAEHDGGAMGMVFDAFLLDDGATRIELDGAWSQTSSAVGVDGEATIDLTTKLDGWEWSVQGTWTSEYDRQDLAHTTCAATGAVEGLGAFDVTCEMVGLGTTESRGWIELVGADTLRVDLERDAAGCFPTTLDGAPHDPICPEETEEPTSGELDAGPIESLSSGGGDGYFPVAVETVKGEVARVEYVMATDRAHVEVHPLAALVGTDALDAWGAELEDGTVYEPGVSTAFDGADRMDGYAVVFAYDADDALVGCMIPGFDEDPGPIDVSACPID